MNGQPAMAPSAMALAAMAPRWIGRAAALALHDRRLAEHGGAAGVADAAAFDAVLARPPQMFDDLYPDLWELAAAYTAGVLRDAPFAAGNAATGFALGALFLALNGRRLTAREADAARMVDRLAAGAITDAAYAAWLRRNSVKAGR